MTLYVTPHLMGLHWLPIRQRIICKVNLIVFKALNGDALAFIQSLLSLGQPLRSLHSSDKVYKLKEHHWNSLPDNIRDIKLNFNEFKNDSKSFYLKVLFNWSSALISQKVTTFCAIKRVNYYYCDILSQCLVTACVRIKNSG